MLVHDKNNEVQRVVKISPTKALMVLVLVLVLVLVMTRDIIYLIVPPDKNYKVNYIFIFVVNFITDKVRGIMLKTMAEATGYSS